MKICVLVHDYEDSISVLKDVDSPRNPAIYDKENLHNFTVVPIKKNTAARQIMEMARSKEFDIYLNLCEASMYADLPGVEVVDTLNKLNLAYTGANPMFYQITKQAMKIAASACGVLIPNHVFAFDQYDVELALKQGWKFPVMVKHYNSHDSVGMTENSKVMNEEQMMAEATRMINDYGGALIEEFIEGPEYTVLVLANPKDPENPVALIPAECKFATGETFKHFDLKWKSFESLTWVPVVDEDLVEKLKDNSRKVFIRSGATGYARCDYRYKSSTNELFFLEINPNPSILYDEPEWCSADYILSYSIGHQEFMEVIIKNALSDQQKRRETVRPFYSPGKGFHMQATEDIPVGGSVKCFEGKPLTLSSAHYIEEHWGPLRKEWLSKFIHQVSPNLVQIWDEDPNKWFQCSNSSDPNACFNGLDVVARKPIRKGDEITLDESNCSNLSLMNQESRKTTQRFSDCTKFG